MITRTISKHTVQGLQNGAYKTVPAAEVWDLPTAQIRQHSFDRVRRIEHTNRKGERPPVGAEPVNHSGEVAFEPRHEKRTDSLMGAVLGLALILGSAAGGVFSHGPSPEPGQSTVEAVTANAR